MCLNMEGENYNGQILSLKIILQGQNDKKYLGNFTYSVNTNLHFWIIEISSIVTVKFW